MSAGGGWSLGALRVWWWLLATVGVATYVAALPAAFSARASGEAALQVDASTYRRALADTGWDADSVATVTLLMAVAYTTAAGVASWAIRRHRSRDRSALFVATILLAHGLGWPAVTDAESGRWVAYDAVGTAIAVYGFVGFFVLAYVFPDGRFVPGWTRWVALALAVEISFASVGLSVTGALPGVWEELAESALGVTVLVTMVWAVSNRYRRVSSQAERQQTRGVGVALLVLAGCFVLTGVAGPLLPDRGATVIWVELLASALFTVGFSVLPLAVASAVLRRGLWGAPPVLRRALVVSAVSAMLIVAYAAAVIAASVLLGTAGPAAGAVGAALVAAAFDPARRAARRWVTRLTLGDRADAESAVTRLSRRLDDARHPDTALPAVLSAVRSAVRSPGAAVVGSASDAVHGSAPGPDAWRTTLRHRGEDVGELVVSPRRGEGFDATDRRLLAELSRSVALAVYAVGQQAKARRLAAELQASRRAIVVAREEERRRLRRDLHDGLGPVLAGQVLRLETARDLLIDDPEGAVRILDRAVTEAAAALDEVRRVVDGLRPAILDDEGLVTALRSRVRQISDRVTLEVPSPLPPLGAAVEVAAYYIVTEAVGNAVRHAPGASCSVSVEATGAMLVLRIEDWGPGVGPEAGRARVGAGMVTMRERAAEIGGVMSVDSLPGRGTVVTAELPLQAAPADPLTTSTGDEDDAEVPA